MVAPNLKGETKELFDRRASLEQQMNAVISRLSAPNGPGLSGNLLDNQGFPRADIDIPAVRSDRNRLASSLNFGASGMEYLQLIHQFCPEVLRNDHKDITAKIEQNLQILLSSGLSHDYQTLPQRRTVVGEELGSQTSVGLSSANSVPIPAISETLPTPMDEDAIARFPFAVVDEISDGSPATIDGLQLGDQILKFGTVEGGDNLVPRLAREGQINEGRAIPIVVIRRGVQVHLNVTPRVWSGRGLLGCHLQSL